MILLRAECRSYPTSKPNPDTVQAKAIRSFSPMTGNDENTLSTSRKLGDMPSADRHFSRQA